MKLHLPVFLRKALLASFATVSYLTVASLPASALDLLLPIGDLVHTTQVVYNNTTIGNISGLPPGLLPNINYVISTPAASGSQFGTVSIRGDGGFRIDQNVTGLQASSILNQGRLQLDANSSLTVAGGVTAVSNPGYPNMGYIELQNGASLTLGGNFMSNANTSISGTLTATTGTIALSGTTNNLNNGHLSAGSALNITNAILSNTTLTSQGNITLGGSLLVYGPNTVTAAGVLTLNGDLDTPGGTISAQTVQVNSKVYLRSTDLTASIVNIAAGTGELSFNAGTNHSVGAVVNAGLFALVNTAEATATAITNTGTLRIDSGTTLHAQTLSSTGTGSTVVNGTLNLSGALSLGGVSNDLDDGIVTASQITLNGTANSLVRSHLTSASSLAVTNAGLGESTLIANGGNITLSGLITSYGSNVITAAANVIFDRDYSSIDDTITALALKVNAAVNLITCTVTADQTDIAVGPASLTLSGGDGYQLGTLTNAGTLTLTAGTTAHAGVVTNSGALNINSTAVLNTGNVASTGTTVISGTLSAAGNVTLGGLSNNLDNGVVNATGTLTVNGASNSLYQAHLTAGSTLSVSNASLSHTVLESETGDITLSGTLASYGTNTIHAGGALSINSDFNSIDDILTAQTLNVNANVYLINGTVTSGQTNISLATGSLTLVNGANYHLGAVVNAGSLSIHNTGTVATAGVVLNTGALTVGAGAALNAGAVTSTSGSSHTEIAGELTAEGAIALGGTGNILREGTITAGTTLDITHAELGNTTLSSGGNMTLGGTITDWGGNNVTAGANLSVSAGASVDLIGNSNVNVGVDLVVEGGLTVGGVLQVEGNTHVTGNGSLTLNESDSNSHLGGSVTVDVNGSLTVENCLPDVVVVVGSGDVTISDSGKTCIINTTYNVGNGNGTITVNDQGKLCIINSTVNGNVVTTNPDVLNSTTVILDNAHISKNLTVVGGELNLSHNNTVGGTLTISDQVIVNVNKDGGATGTLTVTGGTLIKPDASLIVNSDSTFISNVTMTGGSLTINGNGNDLAPSFRGDVTFAGTVGDEASRTVIVNGDHTQTGSIYVDNDGTINVTEGGTMDLQGLLTYHEGADPDAVLTINDGTTGTLEVSSSNAGFRNDINLAGGTLQINNTNEAIGQEGTLYVTGQDVVLRNTAEDAHIGKIINTVGSGNGLTVDTEEDLTLSGAIVMDDTDTLTKTGDALLTLSHEEGGSIGILDQQEGDILVSGTDYVVGQLDVAPGLTFTSEGGNTFSDVTAGIGATVNLEGTNGADTLKGDVILNGAELNADGTEVDIDSLDVLTSGEAGSLGNLTDVSGTITDTTVESGSTLNITGSTLSGSSLTTGGITTITDSIVNLEDTYVMDGILSLKDDVTLGGNVSVEQGIFHIDGSGVTLSSSGSLSFDPDADITTDPESRIIWVSEDFDYAGHLAVNANGNIHVDGGHTMNVNGTFDGTAALLKTGSGVLNFNGTSGYSGTIHLEEGTIGATASNAFGSTSTLSIDGNNVAVNTGTAGGAPVTFDAGLTVAGDHSFVINTLSDTTWNGVLTGAEGALNKTGAATLNLTNQESRNFTTDINLQQGKLAINGSIGSNVDMAAGTFLSGNGVTTGTVTALHDNTVIEIGKAGVHDIDVLTIGGLKAANSIIDGNGVHKSGTVILFDVDLNSSASDLLKITGPADLNNAALQLRAADGNTKVKDNTRFHLIESEGLTSTAHPIVLHNLDLMNVRLDQLSDGKNVDVVLSLNHKGATKTDNQSNVSHTIDTIDKGGFATNELAELVDAFNYTQSEAEAKRALEDAGGNRLTTAMASLLAGNHSHLRQLRDSMGTGIASTTLVRDGKRSWLEPQNTTSIWVDAVYSHNKLNSDGNAPGFSRDAWGGILGIEHTVRPDSLVLGVAFGYDYSRTEVQGSRDNADNWYLDLYGKWKSGNWNSRASVGMGYHDLTNNRFVNVANRFARHGQGGTNAYSLNLGYELSYTFHVDRSSTLEPLFMVESTAGWIDGYTESGDIGNAGLRVEDQDAWSTILGLGARYAKNFTWVTNAPQARFEATAMATVDVGDQGSTVRASYIGAPGYAYNLDSAKRERAGALLGAGLVVPVSESVSFFGGSTLEFHSGSRDLTANMGVRYSF